MPESTSSLLVRIRAPRPDAPDTYPAEVTLDGAGQLCAFITIQTDAFRELESNPWEYGKQLGRAVLSDAGLQRAMAYARGKGAQRVSISLQIDPEAGALQDLLWERLIFASGAEELPFAASTTFALSRRIPSETEAPPPREGAVPPAARPVLARGAGLGARQRADAKDRPRRRNRSLRAAWDSLVRRGLLQVTILGRLPDALARRARKRWLSGVRAGRRRSTRSPIGSAQSTASI